VSIDSDETPHPGKRQPANRGGGERAVIPFSTKIDVAANEWSIDDNVMRLREWGTDTIRVLPQPHSEWTIGAAETCTLQLVDPTGRVSRLHARLVHDGTKWLLRDLGSKNGIRLDGARRTELVLEPGVEIGIGGLTLIAESRRWIELRGFLARLLGWRSDRTEIVDRALRSIRMAATRRVALVLCGDGDLVPIARAIHRRALGTDRPFIVCDPRRRQHKATVRSPENYKAGMAAVTAATGGSLCVRSLRLPRDFSAVVTALRDPSSQVQLVVCAQAPKDCEPYLVVPVPMTVPPLASRPDELDRIIMEYAEDAVTELGTLRACFLPADREWVRTHAASSLPEIEKSTLRLVAIRESRNLSNAAARLGMAPVSLSRWIGRRKLPMHVVP
jgi:Inner membrane component of T3SS, cytoplasmic domain